MSSFFPPPRLFLCGEALRCFVAMLCSFCPQRRDTVSFNSGVKEGEGCWKTILGISGQLGAFTTCLHA